MAKSKPATVDLTGKEDGNLWSCKPSASTNDGLFAHIVNRHPVASSTLQGRTIRFTRVLFYGSGDRLAAIDHLGTVFLISLRQNRFSSLVHLGSPCTALCFICTEQPQLCVALANGYIHLLEWPQGNIATSLRGHTASVQHISVNCDGRYILTTSSAESILWDAKTHQRMRTLTDIQNVGVQQALFVPLSNTLVTCFKDDSIFAWGSDSLEYKFRLAVHDGPPPKFRTLVASSDGRFLVAGGRSKYLHVWALDTRHVVRVIELPDAVRRVDQLFFINDNLERAVSQTLGVVCQDGIVRFLRYDTCRLLFELGSSNGKARPVSLCRPEAEPITYAAPSSDGHYVATIVDSGAVQLFSIETVCPQLSQPPAPLVQTVRAEHSSSGGAKRQVTKTSGSGKVPKPTHSSFVTHSSVTSPQRQETPSPSLPSSSVSFSSSANVSPSTEGRHDAALAFPGETPVPVSKLHALLHGHGRYPEKYREFIWRTLLQLPENHAAYAALCNRGTHIAFEDLQQRYPVKSRKLFRQLQRTLSALAHWSPIFGEVTFLPALVFPFVKLFANNRLLIFEMCATVLINYCQRWFDFHPHVPVAVLGTVETLLAHHDVGLLRHLTQNKITSAVYAWTLLETMFSEALTRDQWLQTMDNVFSQPPHFLLFVVVAFLTNNRRALLHCRKQADFDFFFKHPSDCNITVVLKEATRLDAATPADIHPQTEHAAFEPLVKGQYTVFSHYPTYVVDYQRQERDRIRKEELELLRQHQATLSAHQAKIQRLQDEETFERHKQMLDDAEQERRAQIMAEEQKLHDQRMRLVALKREVQAEDMVAMDAARRRLMERQIGEREAELQRLDDELERKARLRHEETELAVESAQVQAAELDMQKTMLEAEMTGQHHAAQTALRTKWREHELNTAVNVGGSVTGDNLHDVSRLKERQAFEAQQRLAKLQQRNAIGHAKDEVEYREKLDRLEQELENLRIARQELQTQQAVDRLTQATHQAELLQRQQNEQQQHRQEQPGRSALHGGRQAIPMHPVNLGGSPANSDLSVSSLLPSDAEEGSVFLTRPPAHSTQDEEQLLREVTDLRRRVARQLHDGSRSLSSHRTPVA